MQVSRRTVLGAGAASIALGASGEAFAAPHSERFNALLERISTEMLRRSPERCTSLGVSEERAGGRYIDRVSDASKQGDREARAATQRALRDLNRIRRDQLEPQEQITHDVVRTSFENSLANSAFTVGGGAGGPYVVTQLSGVYSSMPNFLAQQHPIRNRDETDAFLTRLDGFVTQMDAQTAIIGEDARAGVIPPDFAIDKAIAQLRAFTSAAPGETAIVQSLERRLPQAADIPEAERAGYLTRAETAVRERIMPAFQRQIEALEAVRPHAVHDAGCWRLPRGEEMYRAALKSRTTTDMDPQEIHDTGRELIRQINGEMDAILRSQGMGEGTVAQRVQALSQREDQLYPNTDEGRAQILADLNEQTRHVLTLMPQAFNRLAQAQLEIRRVPPFTEAGAPGGYYQRGALDGSRPGAYYINLRNTHEWPRFTLPTLNYHEGVPGHHWQGSLQQESGALPFIRSALLGFSAFGEGWALYAEQLVDELGIYADNPLGRLGYLQSAMFRASRLVCDTGLHHLRWSREQAIQSMLEATGDQESSITTEIERYSVWPGQACSYMVGRLVINRLRDESRAALGARFDQKAFHDTMLANGSVPLSVLESVMRGWTSAQA
jgi:uncharacterized protein (DUF885 family)